jgi:hypothetical protein
MTQEEHLPSKHVKLRDQTSVPQKKRKEGWGEGRGGGEKIKAEGEN